MIIKKTKFKGLLIIKQKNNIDIRGSLRETFRQLHAQHVVFQKQSLFCHSINSLDELQQYKQMKAFKQMFVSN